MGYRAHCNWCGKYVALGEQDYAELKIAIHRKRQSKLDTRWAEEVRPTMHFCVTPNGDNNRMGIDEQVEDPDSCFERAMATINGSGTETPDMGLEWRLVPVGATVNEVSSGGETTPRDEGIFAEPLWETESIPKTNGGTYMLRHIRRDLYNRGLNLMECPGGFNAYRLQNDGYETVGDLQRAIEDRSLLEVSGVGPKTFCWIKDHVEAFLDRERAAGSRPRRAAGRA